MADEKSNVIDINCVTTLDIPTEKILETAKEKKLKHVVIIGEYEDGEEYFASSTSDSPLIGWMIDRAKLDLLRMADEDDDDEEDI